MIPPFNKPTVGLYMPLRKPLQKRYRPSKALPAAGKPNPAARMAICDNLPEENPPFRTIAAGVFRGTQVNCDEDGRGRKTGAFCGFAWTELPASKDFPARFWRGDEHSVPARPVPFNPTLFAALAVGVPAIVVNLALVDSGRPNCVGDLSLSAFLLHRIRHGGDHRRVCIVPVGCAAKRIASWTCFPIRGTSPPAQAKERICPRGTREVPGAPATSAECASNGGRKAGLLSALRAPSGVFYAGLRHFLVKHIQPQQPA